MRSISVRVCILLMVCAFVLPLGAEQLTLAPAGDTGYKLVVSGPDGFVAEKVFVAGESAVFETAKLNQGLYSYEIRQLPVVSAEIRALMRKAREQNDNTAIDKLVAEGKLPSSLPVQSGTFAIANGAVVDADTPEEVATKDVLHYDDVIITGSLCIGFDCANGESFGYDTLKLKENNLRFFFEDTSIGSFPTGDWRIKINDTTSGGASYFAVEDATNARTPFRIETGAPNHALYVEDYGRVGLGTSLPYVELHIVDGDSPTVRLDQDGSSGWAAQKWDMCGNETNFFIRDVTNGSKLSFRIQPSTPSNTLCMRSTGYVGIGTWSPANKLDIFNATDDNFGFQLSRSAVQWVVQLNKSTDTGGAPDGLAFTRVGSGVREMQLQADGDLYIEGDYYSDGTRLNVPDFVFEDGYSLLPLNELEQFVKEQRHLPNVPSADRIKEEGLNVSDLQMRLLEKVEELTLYTLQQQGTIHELSGDNQRKDELIDELEQRTRTLEQRLARLEAAID